MRKIDHHVQDTLINRGVLRTDGEGRAHLGPRPMNESLVRCSYDEMRPVNLLDLIWFMPGIP
jgi:hypothetical protein